MKAHLHTSVIVLGRVSDPRSVATACCCWKNQTIWPAAERTSGLQGSPAPQETGTPEGKDEHWSRLTARSHHASRCFYLVYLSNARSDTEAATCRCGDDACHRKCSGPKSSGDNDNSCPHPVATTETKTSLSVFGFSFQPLVFCSRSRDWWWREADSTVGNVVQAFLDLLK